MVVDVVPQPVIVTQSMYIVAVLPELQWTKLPELDAAPTVIVVGETHEFGGHWSLNIETE